LTTEQSLTLAYYRPPAQNDDSSLHIQNFWLSIYLRLCTVRSCMIHPLD